MYKLFKFHHFNFIIPSYNLGSIVFTSMVIFRARMVNHIKIVGIKGVFKMFILTNTLFP